MARIAGVDIPQDKRVEVALTYIKGIGDNLSREILEETGISFDTRVKDLSEEQIDQIREVIEKKGYRVEGELTSQVSMDIKRLKEIGSYRGARHDRGLPVRGQKTQSNARTRKGKAVTVSGTSKSSREAKKSQKT